MDANTREHFEGTAGLAALWFGVLGGPFAWMLQFTINYFATPYLCGSSFQALQYVVSAVMLVTAILALVTAQRSWSKLGRLPESTGGGVLGRSKLLAFGGVAFSSFFIIAIILQALPLFFLDPCRR